MRSIEGQVAIVTGGSKGLGRSIVRVLAEEGCKVVAVARGKSALSEVEREEQAIGHEVIAVQANVADEREVEQAVAATHEAFGDVNILVNNAGVARFAPIEGISTAIYDEIVDTNLKGSFLFTRAIVPEMKRRGSGQIILVSSAAGVRGQRDQSVYSATKFAQVGFAQSLDQELRKYGVRASVLNPGSIDTPLWKDVALDESEKEKWTEWGRNAMSPDDVAEVVRLMVKQDPRTRILQVLMRPMMEPFE